jgi:hypothetical protein
VKLTLGYEARDAGGGQKNMKNPPTWTAKYLVLFAGLFFLAGMRYCWADPLPAKFGGELDYHFIKVIIGEAVVVVLEMFLLRWLLALGWGKALITSFLANLVSAVFGAILFAPVPLIHLATMIFIFFSSLVIAFLIEGLVIWLLNRPLGLERAAKASIIVNGISYPLFTLYLWYLLQWPLEKIWNYVYNFFLY